MRKNFGALSDVYPMPVFIVAAYDEDGNPNCMNAAWGGIYEHKQIMVCLSHGHKTTKNIKIVYGVELSTERNGESVHILGYFKEPITDGPLVIALRKQRENRTKRALKILSLLSIL